MTATLNAVCYYRSKSDTWDDGWQDADYKALKLVKAVKGDEFNHYANFKIGDKTYKLDDTPNGRKFALSYAGWKLANLIKANGGEGSAIIPIPSSNHTNREADFAGLRLANAIVQRKGDVEVRPELYFAEVMQKSSQGGGRDANLINQNLRYRNLTGIDNAIVLDDVYTTGAHAKAVIRFLRAKGVNVEHCYVVGRTAWERPDKMFTHEQEKIDC